MSTVKSAIVPSTEPGLPISREGVRAHKTRNNDFCVLGGLTKYRNKHHRRLRCRSSISLNICRKVFLPFFLVSLTKCSFWIPPRSICIFDCHSCCSYGCRCFNFKSSSISIYLPCHFLCCTYFCVSMSEWETVCVHSILAINILCVRACVFCRFPKKSEIVSWTRRIHIKQQKYDGIKLFVMRAPIMSSTSTQVREQTQIRREKYNVENSEWKTVRKKNHHTNVPRIQPQIKKMIPRNQIPKPWPRAWKFESIQTKTK